MFQKMFNDCKYISTLRFDFYLPTHNVLIEFDGIHHYKSFDYFGGEKTFEETKIKDVIKNEFAKNNNNLIITPHLGGLTYESRTATDIFIAQKLKTIIK